MSKTETKKARILQREIGKDTVSYQSCLRLLRERGFDAAKAQIEEWVKAGDVEVEAMKR